MASSTTTTAAAVTIRPPGPSIPSTETQPSGSGRGSSAAFTASGQSTASGLGARASAAAAPAIDTASASQAQALNRSPKDNRFAFPTQQQLTAAAWCLTSAEVGESCHENTRGSPPKNPLELNIDAQPLSSVLKSMLAVPPPVKDIPFKAVGAVAPVIAPHLEPGSAGANLIAGSAIAKRVISIAELPGKCADAVHTFETAKGRKGYLDGTAKALDIIPSVTDGIALGQEMRVFEIDKVVMGLIGAIGNVASILGAGYLAVNEVIKFVEHITKDKTNYEQLTANLISLVKFTCYTALATLGLVAFIFAMSFSPWLISALAVVSVTASVGGFFYDKIVDPQGKYAPEIWVKCPKTEEVRADAQQRANEIGDATRGTRSTLISRSPPVQISAAESSAAG